MGGGEAVQSSLSPSGLEPSNSLHVTNGPLAGRHRRGTRIQFVTDLTESRTTRLVSTRPIARTVESMQRYGSTRDK